METLFRIINVVWPFIGIPVIGCALYFAGKELKGIFEDAVYHIDHEGRRYKYTIKRRRA